MSGSSLPSALDALPGFMERLDGNKAMVFLDYDGTLSPIVAHPRDATLSPSMRQTLEQLAARVAVAIISGRDLEDVRRRVGVAGIAYAGSHGFDILVPGRGNMVYQPAEAYLPDLDGTQSAMRQALASIDGVIIDRKRFSLAVHYRLVEPTQIPVVEQAVDDALQTHRLRLLPGKKVFELQPDIDWDKGKALRWLLETLAPASRTVMPFYLGDDQTDEAAFATLAEDGVGILVGEPTGPTRAAYSLPDPDQVQTFLQRFVDALREKTP